MSLADNLVNLAKALFAHKSDANGHNLATQSKAGFMSPLDKAKLDDLDGGLADKSVTTAKLADSAVTTVKIGNKSVTMAKLVDDLDCGEI